VIDQGQTSKTAMFADNCLQTGKENLHAADNGMD
jgi:hypothetical protein